MLKTKTLVTQSNPQQQLRLYINKELFIDQRLPFEHSKLTFSYESSLDADVFDIQHNGFYKQLAVSSENTYHVNCNK